MYNELRNYIKEVILNWNQDIVDDDVLDFSKYKLKETILNSDNFKLYKYMPADYYSIRNIETQKIHLSDNGVMNDIYEGIPKIEGRLTYDKYKCLENLAKMTCFSETNNNTLMWSHYAKQYSGVCVEYDIKRLQDDPYNILQHLFPVVYLEKRIISKDIDSMMECNKALTKCINEHAVYDYGDELEVLPLFLCKGKAWSYEREWRIVYTKQDMYDMEELNLCEVNLDFRCVSTIYLGYRINPEIRENIKEIRDRISTTGNTIEIYQSNLDSEGYDIIFERI